MSLGMSAESKERLEAAVTFELSHNEGNGHVFLPRDKLIAATCQLLQDGDPERLEAALDALVERGTVVREQVAGVDACYLRRLWEAETSACLRLNGLLAATVDTSRQADRTLAEIETEAGITYAPQQRQAVRLAAERGVLILTGGPGTGKTTTVRGIVALLQKMGLEIVLAAPTGRAAKRMSELTGMEAQTIHRLLGMNWTEGMVSFQKTEKEPLEADAVIVDEMSMVDLTLFAALLRALRPGTRLVLVGDADQLPSVGAGNVFADLIRSGRVETVFLREVFRQAEKSAIIRNAHAVNQGQPPQPDQQPGGLLLPLPPGRRSGWWTQWWSCARTACRRNMGIPSRPDSGAHPHPEGPLRARCASTGCLQEALNPRAPGKREIQWGERLFREGDRIMQTRNDYEVVWTRSDGTAGHRHVQRRCGPNCADRPGGGMAGDGLRRTQRPPTRRRCSARWSWPMP